MTGTQSGDGTSTSEDGRTHWADYIDLQVPTTPPALVRAVSSTTTRITLLPCLTSSSTTTRKCDSLFSKCRRAFSIRLLSSGYNGVNPNNNPVCNRQIKANCMSTPKCTSITDTNKHCRPGQERDDHRYRSLHGLRSHRPRLLPFCVQPARGLRCWSSPRHDLGVGLNAAPSMRNITRYHRSFALAFP